MKSPLRSVLFKLGAALWLAVAALAAPLAAHAEYVSGQTPFFNGIPLGAMANLGGGSSISTTRVVWGTSLSIHQLSFDSAGRLDVTLTDFGALPGAGWLQPLDSMHLLLTDLDSVWMTLHEPGSFSLDVTGAGRMFIAIVAHSSGLRSPGLYHLRAEYAPVPLPAALWLLLSGAGGLAFVRRKSGFRGGQSPAAV